jgi:hypothetical protein
MKEQLEFILEEVKKPICPVCGNSFEKSKLKKYCSRKCGNRYSSRTYHKKHKEKIKAYSYIYWQKNKEKKKEYGKIYRQKNKEKIKKYIKDTKEKRKERQKKYREENKEKVKNIKKNYYNKNKKTILEKQKKYRTKKCKNDINYKLRRIIRRRIYGVLIESKKANKSNKTFDLLGCNILEVREHLEKQFKDGMTWENHGEWHIDHIIPCASFDLTDPEQQKKCFHYTNIQPLWASENLSKGAKIL